MCDTILAPDTDEEIDTLEYFKTNPQFKCSEGDGGLWARPASR